MSRNLSVCLFVHLSVSLSVCQSICLSVHLSVSPSVCQSVCQSVHLSVSLSVCQSICRSVHLSVSLSVCLTHSERESSELRERLEADLLQMQAQLREERCSQSVSDLEGEGPESSAQFCSSNIDSSSAERPAVSIALHTHSIHTVCSNSVLLFM